MAGYPSLRRTYFARLSSLVIFFAVLPALRAFPDLGSLVAKGDAGPYLVSVLVAPSPLRVGPALFSLAVRDRTSRDPIKNAQILLMLSPPRDARAESKHMHDQHPIQAEARPSQSRHPGLASAQLQLPTAGTWTGQVEIRTPTAKEKFLFELPVGPPQQPWIDYWAAFGLPLAGALVFIWHQRRVRSRKAEPEA